MKQLICIFIPFICFAEVNKSNLVTILFVGHSNMKGMCGKKDTILSDRAFYYSLNNGFCKLSKLSGRYQGAGQMFLFVQQMLNRYQDKYFCAIQIASSGATASNTFANDTLNQIKALIDSANSWSTIGCVVVMLGFNERKDSALANNFSNDLAKLIYRIRAYAGNSKLPFVIGLNEENAYMEEKPEYNTYKEIISNQITSFADSFCVKAPIRQIAKELYCDSHHYSEIGQEIFSEDAAVQLQLKKLDFWR